jgi:competence protein ComFC
MYKLWSFIQSIIAPPFCYYCREYSSEDLVLCSSCLLLVRPIISTTIVLNPHYKMQVHAISAYEEPLKSLILAKSWSDYTAGRKLGTLIGEHSVLRHISFDYLIPIPLHRSRYAYRGFNQSDLIATQLGVITGKKVLNCLTRTKRTRFQSRVSAPQRQKNVEKAFALNTCADIEGKVLVLIDDLMTSGATLREAGRELIQGRPKGIHAVVACRVV